MLKKYKNSWGIPLELAKEVFDRDVTCIYCHCPLNDSSGGAKGSWEHIINDATLICSENIARCCRSCNSSKGTKTLEKWFQSAYCKNKNISIDTVAEIVRIHILTFGVGSKE